MTIPDDVDGLPMWDALLNNYAGVRNAIVHNIDEDVEEGTVQAVITHNNYKMIWGQEFLLGRSQHQQRENIQLFDIDKDPLEKVNVAAANDKIVENLKMRILDEKKNLEFARTALSTRRGWPANYNGYLSPGWCEL